MNRLLIGIVSALLVTGGVATAETLTGSDEAGKPRTVSVGDIPGPCDEPEHVGDPRCAGTTTGGDDGRTVSTVDDDGRTVSTVGDDARHGVREPGEDISGPCDEAEHANDPRCTGAAGVDQDRGRGRRGRDDDSGRRGESGRHDNSGPGGGGHSGRGDRSGSNRGNS